MHSVKVRLSVLNLWVEEYNDWGGQIYNIPVNLSTNTLISCASLYILQSFDASSENFLVQIWPRACVPGWLHLLVRWPERFQLVTEILDPRAYTYEILLPFSALSDPVH